MRFNPLISELSRIRFKHLLAVNLYNPAVHLITTIYPRLMSVLSAVIVILFVTYNFLPFML